MKNKTLKTGSENTIRRIIDISMSLLLLFLMAYQLTGQMIHEWIGVTMIILVTIHQILNRRWYKTLLKGKYNSYRAVSTVINILLILSFILTGFSGISMSGYALPFLYGMAPVSLVRRMHLSMSHFSYVLMGIHLGIHVPAMIDTLKLSEKTKRIITYALTIIGAVGLWILIKNRIFDYLLFRVPFAYFDYDKPWWLVFVENISGLLFWVFTGMQAMAQISM